MSIPVENKSQLDTWLEVGKALEQYRVDSTNRGREIDIRCGWRLPKAQVSDYLNSLSLPYAVDQNPNGLVNSTSTTSNSSFTSIEIKSNKPSKKISKRNERWDEFEGIVADTRLGIEIRKAAVSEAARILVEQRDRDEASDYYSAFPWLDEKFGSEEVFDFAWAASSLSSTKENKIEGNNVISFQEAVLRKGIVNGFFDKAKNGAKRGTLTAALFILAGCGISNPFDRSQVPTPTPTRGPVVTSEQTERQDDIGRYENYLTTLTFPTEDPDHGNFAHKGGKIDSYLAEFYGATGNDEDFDPGEDALVYAWEREADPHSANRYNAGLNTFNLLNAGYNDTEDVGWVNIKDFRGRVAQFKTLTKEGWKLVFEAAGGAYTPSIEDHREKEEIGDSDEVTADPTATPRPSTESVGPGFSAGPQSYMCKDGLKNVADAIAKAQKNQCILPQLIDHGVNPNNLRGFDGKLSDLFAQYPELRAMFPLNQNLDMYVKDGNKAKRMPFQFSDSRKTNLLVGDKIVNINEEVVILTDGNQYALFLKRCGNLVFGIPQPKVTPSESPTPTRTPTPTTVPIESPAPTATRTPTPTEQPRISIPGVPPAYAAPAPVPQPGFFPERPFRPEIPLFAICEGINPQTGQPDFRPVPLEILRQRALSINPNLHPNDIEGMLRVVFERNCRQVPPPVERNIPVCFAIGDVRLVSVYDLRNMAATLGINPNLPIPELQRLIELRNCVPTPVIPSTPTPPGTVPPATPTGTLPPATATEGPTVTVTLTRPPATATEGPTPPPTNTLRPTPPSTPTIPPPQPTGAVPTATRGPEITQIPTATRGPARTQLPTPSIPPPQPTNAVATATRGVPVTPTIPGR